ncbi:uncharacterized protein BXZ73DRAFT_89643 [Epithele typhae]|uniref:uncharacterized protein n=1 Tax=Epithele typhae TaxID=378194 RepID=UPI002007EDC2|nr:uncharacterized protein BXZ73DRAFT_89643 [Epithele typhae]KAH9933965.1 hypothetical protein BXZ73DRAFT_89643 [Epithele typhae]
MSVTPAPTGTLGSELKRDPRAFPLDENKLTQLLGSSHVAFLREQTGINDEEQLRAHILTVTKMAYEVFPYQCIRLFAFAAFRVPSIPNYDHLLRLGKEREGAILLDIGCCFGTDSRKIAADGWPAQNIVASDIHPEFWALGHTLFGSTTGSFPATFVPGDALSPIHLTQHPILPTSFSALPSDLTPLDLSALSSLNPLAGRVSAIHAGALFHLFSAADQARLARALAGLLAPHPGATIAGSHSAAPDRADGEPPRAEEVVMLGADGSAIAQFRHSPASWAALWDGAVFEKGTVRVETELQAVAVASGDGEEVQFWMLWWAVTRV